jgi:2-polyprenyl-3-methyl-5-hydroxy-6-metoxy-1,4-benzoquinol methylase
VTNNYPPQATQTSLTGPARVEEHYDAVAEGYHLQYERDLLYSAPEYPANYFRLQILLNAFTQKNIRRVIEVGVGEGTPLKTMANAGMEVWGFDISQQMVEKSKAMMQSLSLDPDRVFWGDVQDPITYSHVLKAGAFDGLIAMGVMPHIQNDHQVIKNMGALVKPGGSVFIEFRNKLFSLFTFNRYTMDFILNDLLVNVSDDVKQAVEKELSSHLRMDLPPRRSTVEGTDKAGYDAILSKFHNPLEISELFTRNGFQDIQLHWYHYHPTPPMMENKLPELFRQEAIRLEHEPSGWRGLFLCSAFVVEAVKV